jgi:hypothetical protein
MAQASSAQESSDEELDAAPGVKIFVHPGSLRGFHQHVDGREKIETGDLIPSEQSDLHYERTFDAVENDVGCHESSTDRTQSVGDAGDDTPSLP